ncbi:MAG: hypothetical protein AAF990_06465 [Bacteroidota bacterium]
MKYEFLKNAQSIFGSNPFFDVRENKGCSPEEVKSLKEFLQPYKFTLPKVIEEELLLFGKFVHNWDGLFFNMQLAFSDKEFDYFEELKRGFWVLQAPDTSIQIIGLKIEELSDDPPLQSKWPGDDDDDSYELELLATSYSKTITYFGKYYMDKYTSFYQSNPKAYEYKQSIIELYSAVESLSEFHDSISNPVSNPWRYPCRTMRLNAGRIHSSPSRIPETAKEIHFIFKRPEFVELLQNSVEVRNAFEFFQEKANTLIT